MRERLAPPVAGDGHTHQACVQRVLQIAPQHAVLDQHRALGRVALIIDVQRSPPSRDRAIVHHGHTRRRNPLADAAAEGGAAFAVEVALQPVANGLVQQYAGPARAKHHSHGAGRCGPRLQVDQRLVHGFVGVAAQHLIGKIGVVEAPSAAGRALLTPPVFLGDDLQRHAHQGPHVGTHHAVGPRDQDDFVLPPQTGYDLLDTRVAGPSHALQPLQERDLVRVLQTANGIVRQVERAPFAAAFHRRAAPGALARDGTGGLRRRLQRGQADVVGVGEGCLVAAHGSHAHTLLDMEAAGLDDPLLEAPAFPAAVLKIQIGVVDLMGHDLSEHSGQPGSIQTVGRQKRAVGGGKENFAVCGCVHARCVLRAEVRVLSAGRQVTGVGCRLQVRS